QEAQQSQRAQRNQQQRQPSTRTCTTRFIEVSPGGCIASGLGYRLLHPSHHARSSTSEKLRQSRRGCCCNFPLFAEQRVGHAWSVQPLSSRPLSQDAHHERRRQAQQRCC